MLKHIRTAIRLAGLKASQVKVVQGLKGHIELRHNGKRIKCSSSPKDPHVAALRIAKDLA
jgi:hypothetical protein